MPPPINTIGFAAVPSPRWIDMLLRVSKRFLVQSRLRFLHAPAENDASDLSRVVWAMTTRCQWSRNTFVIPDAPGSSLDPSARTEGLVDKVGIDATAKPTLESFAPRGQIPSDVLSRLNLDDYLTSR